MAYTFIINRDSENSPKVAEIEISERFSIWDLQCYIASELDTSKYCVSLIFKESLINPPEKESWGRMMDHFGSSLGSHPNNLKIIIKEPDEIKMESQRKMTIKLGIGVGVIIGIGIGMTMGVTGYLCTHELAALWFIGSIVISSVIGGAIGYIKKKDTPLITVYKSPVTYTAEIIYYARSREFDSLTKPSENREEISYSALENHYAFDIKALRSKTHPKIIKRSIIDLMKKSSCVITNDIVWLLKIWNDKIRLTTIKDIFEKLADENLLTQDSVTDTLKIPQGYLQKFNEEFTNLTPSNIKNKFDALIYKYTFSLTNGYKNALLSRGYYRNCLFDKKEYNSVKIDSEIDEFAKITQAYLR